MVKVCIAREFTHWALNQTSPIIGWLRALARNLHHEVGGPGVGAVGMCFSGGFALAMMVDDIMVAPVLSQPSMPFAVGQGRTAAPTSTCRPTMRWPWPAAPPRAARCWACASPATSWSATASQRCDDCWATRSSPSSCPARPSATTRVLTEQRDEPSVQRVLAVLPRQAAARVHLTAGGSVTWVPGGMGRGGRVA